MRKFIAVLFFISLVGTLISGCVEDSSYRVEQVQQEENNLSIIKNQPVPNLGGYSFERHVMIEVVKARNDAISTYTYMMVPLTGQIMEICASIGYPIPYATQLTNPQKLVGSASSYTTVGNPEPNTLYPPTSADAIIVNCVEEDGTFSPQYFEDKVFATTYRIKADRVLERVDGSESSLTINK